MKKLSVLAIMMVLSISSAALAADSDDKVGCSLYSKGGAMMAEFMLPLTMQEMVNMMNGKDPALMLSMSRELMNGWDQTEMTFMMSLSQEDIGPFGEATGQVAIETLMSGQATSSQEVKAVMQQQCEKIGFKAIIANQKAANAALARNLGQ